MGEILISDRGMGELKDELWNFFFLSDYARREIRKNKS